MDVRDLPGGMDDEGVSVNDRELLGATGDKEGVSVVAWVMEGMPADVEGVVREVDIEGDV